MKFADVAGRAMVVVATVGAVSLGVTGIASAHALDGKDPYSTGCDDTKSAGPAYDMLDRHGNVAGSIRLMWSSYCKTNWTEIRVSTAATGTIWVHTEKNQHEAYTYSAGNGGHHWGDMLYAPGVCAWGTATASNPTAQGKTPSRCG